MSQHDLQLDFDCNDRDVDIYDWLAFWDSTRFWLSDRGYTLFEFGYHWGGRYEPDPSYWVPKLGNPSVSNVKHPFSKFGGDPEDIPTPPLVGSIVVRPSFPRSFNAHSI